MTVSENPYFDENMALLKAYHPLIYETVLKHQDPAPGIEVIRSGNNKPNLAVQESGSESVLIHEPTDPGKEANAFLSMVPEDSTGVLLMFGMGLGYSVGELLKKRKRIQYLVVFELNPKFFVEAVRNMDLSDAFKDPRLIICLESPENLGHVMAPVHKALMLENVHTLNLTTCFRVNPAYGELAPVVADYIAAFNSEGNTKLAYGRTFIENRLKHLTSMHHDRKLEELDGKFKGVPALIVAAGPSLDKNIDQIHDAVGKAVIICVDSALPALLAKGITPDFVTSIDYQELTWEKISRVAADPACKKINLICTSWVTDLVPKRFPAKNIFWAFSRNALENWINLMMGGRISIGGAGTVAHLNFVSADLMGCDPIVFLGQDLAFSKRKGHSQNVVLSNDTVVERTMDSGRDLLTVKGVETSQVFTTRQMLGYRKTFEKMVQESNSFVINATQGGAFIEGAHHMSLSEVIDKYCNTTVDVRTESSGIRTGLLGPVESAVRDLNKAERNVKKAEKLSLAVQKKLDQIKKGNRKIQSFSELPDPLQKKISDLDGCHKKADNTPLFSLFDEMTMEILRENEREQKDIARLEGNPERYFDWLTRSVARIDKINQIRMTNLAWLKKQLKGIAAYYKKEALLLKQLRVKSSDKAKILDLAEFYFQAGNFIQLEALFEQVCDEAGELPGLDFYTGIIDLHREAFDRAETKFKKVLARNPAYAVKIQEQRHAMAGVYLGLARGKKNQFSHEKSRRPIVDLLFLKALSIFPEHEDVVSEIRLIASEDYEKVTQSAVGKTDEETLENEKRIQKWILNIGTAPVLIEVLGKRIVSGFYSHYGRILTGKQRYQEALENYLMACSLTPDLPDIHLSLADICFAVNDFDTGLEYLKKAVALDKSYAVYWQNMGDNLRAQGDVNGAVLAYEQFYMSAPEQIGILKKIGDCYSQLGNLEAARESYRIFKKLLEK